MDTNASRWVPTLRYSVCKPQLRATDIEKRGFVITILSLQLFLTGTGRDEEVATTRLGKPTGALQYAYLLFLAALEVLPESDIIATVHGVYFVVLALAIVANSIECIIVMRNIARTVEND